jgi:hypothetical protein
VRLVNVCPSAEATSNAFIQWFGLGDHPQDRPLALGQLDCIDIGGAGPREQRQRGLRCRGAPLGLRQTRIAALLQDHRPSSTLLS